MANAKLIESLNRALGFELAAVIQYMQHSFLVTGTEREVYCSYFRAQSEESHGHAKMLGDKIVSLGGVPTVEPGMIRQPCKPTWRRGRRAATGNSRRASCSKGGSRTSSVTSRSWRS